VLSLGPLGSLGAMTIGLQINYHMAINQILLIGAYVNFRNIVGFKIGVFIVSFWEKIVHSWFSDYIFGQVSFGSLLSGEMLWHQSSRMINQVNVKQNVRQDQVMIVDH
jgi:hypothetical protein